MNCLHSLISDVYDGSLIKHHATITNASLNLMVTLIGFIQIMLRIDNKISSSVAVIMNARSAGLFRKVWNVSYSTLNIA